MSPLAILFATSEMAPWVKTGGLGDVAAALPVAVRQTGHDIRVLLPYYPALRQAFPDAACIGEIPSLAPDLPPARLLAAESAGLPLLLLDCPALYDRPGNPYLGPDGHDWPDNAIRFGLLSRVAALLGQSALHWTGDLMLFTLTTGKLRSRRRGYITRAVPPVSSPYTTSPSRGVSAATCWARSACPSMPGGSTMSNTTASCPS